MKKLFSKVRKNQFLRAFFHFYKEADSELSSVAVAYYWLISVFPLLLIVVNILPYFHIPIADFLTAIKDMLPETLYDVVAKVIDWAAELLSLVCSLDFFQVNEFSTDCF